MDENKRNYNRSNPNNPTERPGYSNTQQKYPELMFPVEDEAKKPKSRLGLGIGIGILIMLAVFVILSVISGVTRFLGSSDRNTQLNYTEKIEFIKSYLDAYYMGEIDAEGIEDGIAKGMLHGTGDKYAEYYNQKEYKELLESISGNYAGIGVSIAENADGLIEIYRVFDGSPAADAGLLVGDIIVEAAGSRDFADSDELVALVRGEPGTTVDVTVKRNDEELSFTIERKNIEVPTVESKMLDGNIGYIGLYSFEVATVKQFDDALTDLEEAGAESIIMDLRDNPGGDYDSVVQIADRVLPEGVIISTKDKDGNVDSENSDAEHQLKLPCVVLVNQNSASAAELFTGAMQDYKLATVVGTVTYGKGVVQSIFELPDGSGMKFTTETYYTPNGRDIDGIGIVPDVEVELPKDALEDGVLDEAEDTQLQMAIDILTGKTTVDEAKKATEETAEGETTGETTAEQETKEETTAGN